MQGRCTGQEHRVGAQGRRPGKAHRACELARRTRLGYERSYANASATHRNRRAREMTFVAPPGRGVHT